MEIEFDPAKDAANRRKHGVSLDLGAVVLAHLLGEDVDDREDYGEERMTAFGLVGLFLYACTYTLRGRAVRIISVRRATRAEERKWLS